MRATHTITGLASLKRTLWLKTDTRIVLALPGFSVVQQENLEALLNRRLRDSGSEFCILAFIVALVVSILVDADHWELFTAHDAKMIAANLLVCLAAALFGKTLGILRARWQLARLIWSVVERLEDMEENASPLAYPSSPRGDLFVMHDHRATGLSRASIY